MDEAATLPEAPSSSNAPPAPTQVELRVIWAPNDGYLLGSALLPLQTPSVFGRGTGETGGPPRLQLSWRRPGPLTRPNPLNNGKISRNQLTLQLTPRKTVLVQNTGMCPLFFGGEEVKQCELSPGQVFALGGQLAFLCVHRPGFDPHMLPDFPPGEADAEGIVGESSAVWQLRQGLRFAALRDEHLLVLGASGTGKELIARALHSRSKRSAQPLVSRNAATIPETLVDAELFGNARNYPNPGMADRPGLIGQANLGTLFLDEFAELPPGIQAHLLRVLDGGEYQRLGEASLRRSDFRLVAATNRPLSALKEDVAARFALRLRSPDLNERPEDIPLLARHLLRRIAARDPMAVQSFFPGNDPTSEPQLSRDLLLTLVQHTYTTHVRELLALLWESIQHSPSDTLLAIPALAPPEALPASAPGAPEEDDSTLTAERIQRALDDHNGSIEKTWKALGLPSRFVLRRLIQRYGLEVRKSL